MKNLNYHGRARGFGLVELMVALIIGLIVIGGAISVFGVNRQTYRTTENLGRMQENGRIAFELMSRDVREAGGNACGRNLPIANTLTAPGDWWRDFGDGLQGYTGAVASPGAPFGAGAGQRVAGTEAIELRSSAASDGVTVVSHNPSSAILTINTAVHDFSVGDILMVCDYRQASIFQMTHPAAMNATIGHNQSGANCTKGLGVPVVCTTNGTPYSYGPNSILSRLSAVTWFVGNSAQGGRSLYRRVLNEPAQEIVNGVINLQLSYAVPGVDDYIPANLVGNWGNVTGVRIVVTTQSEEAVGTEGQLITRNIDHVVNLRNRVP